MPIIELDRVTFRHAGATEPALRDVSLAIEGGELVAILGRNGAGKSTLALMLDGIVPNLVTGELTGSIRVAGLDPSRTPVPEMAGVVGVVFDTPEFQVSQATVAEEVAFGLENLGVPREEMRGGSRRCSPRSGSPASRTASRSTSRAASSSGSRSPRCWSCDRGSS